MINGYQDSSNWPISHTMNLIYLAFAWIEKQLTLIFKKIKMTFVGKEGSSKTLRFGIWFIYSIMLLVPRCTKTTSTMCLFFSLFIALSRAFQC